MAHPLHCVISACALLAASPAVAAETRSHDSSGASGGSPPATLLPAPKEQSGVRYLAGGIGADVREAMRDEARRYSVQLSFSAGRDQHYVPDIHVTVRDGRNNVVFELGDAGPLLYLDLPAGHYSVEVEHSGRTQRRSLPVGAGGTRTLGFFHFPGEA
jgi:hypothetical protein